MTMGTNTTNWPVTFHVLDYEGKSKHKYKPTHTPTQKKKRTNNNIKKKKSKTILPQSEQII